MSIKAPRNVRCAAVKPLDSRAACDRGVKHPGQILIERRALIVRRMRSTCPQECERITAELSILAEDYEIAMREKEAQHVPR